MTDTPNSQDGDQPLGFEPALARIEAIVHELEEGQTGLAESLGRYEEAVQLLRQCYGLLEKAERRIELLVGADAAGNPVTEPFDDTASAERPGLSRVEGEQKGGVRSRRRAAPAAKVSTASSDTPPGASPGDVDVAAELF